MHPAPMCASSPIVTFPHRTTPGETWANDPMVQSCSIVAEELTITPSPRIEPAFTTACLAMNSPLPNVLLELTIALSSMMLGMSNPSEEISPNNFLRLEVFPILPSETNASVYPSLLSFSRSSSVPTTGIPRMGAWSMPDFSTMPIPAYVLRRQ